MCIQECTGKVPKKKTTYNYNIWVLYRCTIGQIGTYPQNNSRVCPSLYISVSIPRIPIYV